MPRPLAILLHGTRFSSRAWAGYDDLLDADVRPVDLPGVASGQVSGGRPTRRSR